MIKHETSIEEAKQIKELGFDFSSTCDKFYSETEEKYYYFDTNSCDILTSDMFQAGDNDVDTSGVLIEYFEFIENNDPTPIIPYPILEACLPVKQVNKRISNRFLQMRRVDSGWVIGVTGILKRDIKSIIEAFIHCAKNYPTETKEQFNKVMEMYK